MVITQINSGLGNQLFQYAAGFSLAQHFKTTLKIDKTWYDFPDLMQTGRKYDLGVFNLPENFATDHEIKSLTHPFTNSIWGRFKARQNRIRPAHQRLVYEEPFFHFDSNFFQAHIPTLLIGYWQSEKYFLPFAKDIRNRFSLTISKDSENANWEKLIRNSEAISIHVRRGDMVSNPEVARVHGSCDINYYNVAINQIVTGIQNPVFFVFSDDPIWCKANLQVNYPIHFISNNQGDNSYWDMQLMSHCKHHIIANSSFSWWGAWLNSSLEKRVIAPKRWFATDDKDTKDIIPATWTRI